MNKIFCLGFHKTGTLSLHHALERLGFKSRHGYKPQSDLIERALRDGKQALQYVEDQTQKRGVGEHDAWLDLYSIRRAFTVLDKQYPNSKFILTVRDEASWVKSVHRQRERRHDTPFFHYWYFQSEDQWRLEKIHHEWAVKTYFSARPDDLLIMDITKGDGYEKLAPFLGCDVPDEKFPHKNESKVTHEKEE